MEHVVLKPFIDEATGVFLMPGASFVCDDYNRVELAHGLGFIQKNDESENLKKPSTTKKVTKNATKG
mgnify:FL=1